MAELPSMIKDLALILVMAGIVTLIFKKLKQPLVLGYIVAGFLVSPHMPYTASVVDVESIHLWADIGVMFLLFSLGLDFSFKKILRMGASPIISTCTIIFCMSMLGLAVGRAFWLGTDGLHIPWGYVGYVINDDYLQSLSMIWDYVSSSLPAW